MDLPFKYFQAYLLIRQRRNSGEYFGKACLEWWIRKIKWWSKGSDFFLRTRWWLREVSKDNEFEVVVCVGGRCLDCRPGGNCMLSPISLVVKVSEDSDEASARWSFIVLMLEIAPNTTASWFANLLMFITVYNKNGEPVSEGREGIFPLITSLRSSNGHFYYQTVEGRISKRAQMKKIQNFEIRIKIQICKHDYFF